jgi:hypothetical protein
MATIDLQNLTLTKLKSVEKGAKPITDFSNREKTEAMNALEQHAKKSRYHTRLRSPDYASLANSHWLAQIFAFEWLIAALNLSTCSDPRCA